MKATPLLKIVLISCLAITIISACKHAPAPDALEGITLQEWRKMSDTTGIQLDITYDNLNVNRNTRYIWDSGLAVLNSSVKYFSDSLMIKQELDTALAIQPIQQVSWHERDSVGFETLNDRLLSSEFAGLPLKNQLKNLLQSAYTSNHLFQGVYGYADTCFKITQNRATHYLHFSYQLGHTGKMNKWMPASRELTVSNTTSTFHDTIYIGNLAFIGSLDDKIVSHDPIPEYDSFRLPDKNSPGQNVYLVTRRATASSSIQILDGKRRHYKVMERYL